VAVFQLLGSEEAAVCISSSVKLGVAVLVCIEGMSVSRSVGSGVAVSRPSPGILCPYYRQFIMTTDVTVQQLELKERLCREVLQLLERLGVGQCTMRGTCE
jgi:hypothetical protein